MLAIGCLVPNRWQFSYNNEQWTQFNYEAETHTSSRWFDFGSFFSVVCVPFEIEMKFQNVRLRFDKATHYTKTQRTLKSLITIKKGKKIEWTFDFTVNSKLCTVHTSHLWYQNCFAYQLRTLILWLALFQFNFMVLMQNEPNNLPFSAFISLKVFQFIVRCSLHFHISPGGEASCN